MAKFPGDPYFKSFALKQDRLPSDLEQQTLLISGLPSALKMRVASYGKLTATWLGTCISNNLSSPEPRGSVGTVAQEEPSNIMTAPMRIVIKDFTITYLLSGSYIAFFFLLISLSV